jgi:hypothetical protein
MTDHNTEPDERPPAAAARVRAVAPLLAVEQDTKHGPTQALLDRLRLSEWGVKWRQGGNAMLVHPTFGTLEVEIDPDNTDRLRTFIDGRQVPHRVAMMRADGET